MRILITGITGFAGGHLAEALGTAPGVQLAGISLRKEWPRDMQHLGGCVELITCDLCDGAAVEESLRRVQPERIFHLAGYANAGQSYREKDAAWAGNLTATRCLYDAVERWGGKPRIVYVGSGLIYGDLAAPDQAHTEDAPMYPGSPYAASKAAADLASYQYTRSPGLDVVRARPFNHCGPRQSAQYAVANFARQIAAIEKGQQPPVLETGNLSALRDLTDVRDVAQAYIALMERGRTGEAYNVAAGMTHSMQWVLDQLLALARVKIEVRSKSTLLRATETTIMRGDAGKLRRETGWALRYPLPQTLADTLDYWRNRS
jgi:GDP-4-dehydro-6-deoxy-D-mannose reductase